MSTDKQYTDKPAAANVPARRPKRDPIKPKALASPFATGSGGANFETRVQAVFALLMLARGVSPCLPRWPIASISLQARRAGFEIDDIVICVVEPNSAVEAKLLCQVKHDLSFTLSDTTFAEVISAAWRDFNGNFSRGRDALAIVTGPLSGTDLEVRTLLEWSRTSSSAQEYYEKVELARFSSDTKREKQVVIEECLVRANAGSKPSMEDVWQFLKSLHMLQFDLDTASGVNLSLADCVLTQFSGYHFGMWPSIVDAVQTSNQNAGTITRETFPQHIVEVFDRHSRTVFESEVLGNAQQQEGADRAFQFPAELAVAQLIGSWNEAYEGDRLLVERIAGEPYNAFILKLRLDLRLSGYPLAYRNGTWSVRDREGTWRRNADMVFDDHVQRLCDSAVEALTANDDAEASEDEAT